MIGERNDARNTGEPFAWSDFFPAILAPPSRTGSQKFAIPLAAAGLAMFYFGVPLSRESDDRLEAKIDRLLSEHGIDPAQFELSGGRRSPG
jgi:hypothetical protein